MSDSNLVDLATLEAAVRFRGDYQNTRRFSPVDVRREIQKSFNKWYALIDSTHEGYWDTQTEMVTVPSQAYAKLPSSVWKVKGVDRLDGTEYVELRQVGIDRRNDYGNSTGIPSAYRLSARGLELYCAPDAIYTLRIINTPKAPQLMDAKQFDFINGWDDYVVECTLLALDKREGKPLRERMENIDMMAAQIKSEASERKAQEPDYIPLREGSGATGHFPFYEID